MHLTNTSSLALISILVFAASACDTRRHSEQAYDNDAADDLLPLRPLNNTDKHYIKLDKDGNKLANQNASWLASGSEKEGSQWSCILDKKTGLIWEVKSQQPDSPRAQQLNYTWHFASMQIDNNNNTSSSSNRGDIHSTDCNGVMCTTEAYQSYLNKTTLCGMNEWQIPSVLEFQTIVNHHVTPRAIDTHYFPLAVNSHYWTKHAYAPDRSHAWYLYFSDGSVSHTRKDQPMFLRLVSTSRKAL